MAAARSHLSRVLRRGTSLRRVSMKSEVAEATGSMGRTAASEAGEIVLCKGTKVMECSDAAGAWLGKAPRGAYTTARTVGLKSVFEFETHVARLAESALLMMEDDVAKGGPDARSKNEPLTDATALRALVIESLRAGMNEYLRRVPNFDGELKLTFLSTWAGADSTRGGQTGDCELYSHISALPARPTTPVKVLIHGAPRDNAVAKDSEWVRQRQGLADAKPDDVNEVLLESSGGEVLEGMTSNFFVTQGGTVRTAGTGVLEGTVRKLVLEVCEREGVSVCLDAPNIKEVSEWDGAFISSTSRLALPVDEVAAPDEPGAPTYAFPNQTLVRRIEQLVLAEIEAHSSIILE